MNRLISGNIPAYVSVYNSLYADIMNSVYAQGSVFPGETSLAQKYNVSRNTLRQALAILCEDGLIVKSQGKGTLVSIRKQSAYHGKIVNPMTSMCKKTIDDIEMQYNYGSPTNIGRAKLGLSKSDIVLASTNIYKSGDTVVGYSFTQVPTSVFEEFGVTSASESSLDELVETKIFENASKNLFDIKLIYANEMESEILKIAKGEALLLIESILHNKAHQAFARCKFHFISQHYQLHFQA